MGTNSVDCGVGLKLQSTMYETSVTFLKFTEQSQKVRYVTSFREFIQFLSFYTLEKLKLTGRLHKIVKIILLGLTFIQS